MVGSSGDVNQGTTVGGDERACRGQSVRSSEEVLASSAYPRRNVFQTLRPTVRNGNIHQSATPTQSVLVLAESAVPYRVVNPKKPPGRQST
jgi:hypothetical protein